MENLETFALGKLTMYVSDDHRFGTDAFLLAYYANVRPDSVVCDLCTGCGIIPLIFCKNVMPHLVYAVISRRKLSCSCAVLWRRIIWGTLYSLC